MIFSTQELHEFIRDFMHLLHERECALRESANRIDTLEASSFLITLSYSNRCIVVAEPNRDHTAGLEKEAVLVNSDAQRSRHDAAHLH